MATRFMLKEFNRTFATREKGEELREELLRRLAGDVEVLVDFDEVTNVSYSFADEFLGRLCAETEVQVATANLTPGVGRVVGRAIDRRAGVA